ncbi:MAG: hypothetical protein OXD37_08700 [Acidimicrobiaceae bacterium]|nr:hypothetical protein [Acidimicrobiaceae bacterium]
MTTSNSRRRSNPPNSAASRNGNGSAEGSRRRSRRGRSKSAVAQSAKTASDFWGEVDKLPSVEEVVVSPDPSAVVRSLGRPPFSGHEAVSEYYLRVVYDNTAKLAEVLATAGDLLESSADNDS